MKYLVTGGAGFIGSHLVDQLLRLNHQVTILDDLSEGKLMNLSLQHPNLTMRVQSILSNMASVDECFDGQDGVFHLAALTRPQQSIVEPEITNETNVTGTLKVLRHCVKAGVKRLVFASSASLYGEQPTYPSKEDAIPNPMSPYALQKLIGEQYCKLFTSIYGLETNCMRFFNVYGTRQNPSGGYASLIPRCIYWASEGMRPTVFGTGEQCRDFVYVSDIVDGLIKAMNTSVIGEVFNLGSGENISVNAVVELVYSLMREPYITNFTDPMIEPTQTLADIRKAMALLDWTPKVSMREGINKMLAAKGLLHANTRN